MADAKPKKSPSTTSTPRSGATSATSTSEGGTATGRPAKTAPPNRTGSGNRRQQLASFEAARKKEQRRRSVGLLVICIVLAIALLSYPTYLFVQDYRARNATISDFGASLSAASCDPVAQHPATGNQEHVAEGTTVAYAQTPPDSGKHYPSPAPFTKHFYAVADRPAIETLVHNLEHGYTVVWYREDLPAQQLKDLQSIAKTFANDDYNPSDKFIAAPWTASDPQGFPAGKDVVLTRWYADPTDPSDTTKQLGTRQPCGAVSGEAIKDFMAKYPATSAPEPNGA